MSSEALVLPGAVVDTEAQHYRKATWRPIPQLVAFRPLADGVLRSPLPARRDGGGVVLRRHPLFNLLAACRLAGSLLAMTMPKRHVNR